MHGVNKRCWSGHIGKRQIYSRIIPQTAGYEQYGQYGSDDMAKHSFEAAEELLSFMVPSSKTRYRIHISFGGGLLEA